MFKKLFYLISIVSLMAVSTQVQADVIFSDNFDHAMMDDWSRINYQGWYEQEVLGWPSPGGPWAIGDWDGYQSLPDDSGASPTLIAHPVINAVGNVMWGDPNDPNAPQTYRPGYEGPELNGVLRISSTNGAWENDRNSGAFLYKMVEGDFVATVEVVAYDVFWHHLGSLMARVPNPGEVGADELWTQLNCFPLYGIGNRVMDKTGPGNSSATGVKGYPPDRFLKLQREGNTFSYYTSPDGVTYSSLMTLSDPDDPNSPMIPLTIIRDDFPAEIQVGIAHCNFTGDWVVNMDFDNFSIETVPESVDQEIIIEDDFEAEAIDLGKWQLLNGPDVNITQAGGQVFFDRPQTQLNYLITADQYDPAVTPLTITGSAVTGPEGLSIWTRASNIGNTADSAQHVLDSGIRIPLWPEGEANAWYDGEIIEKTAGTWPWSGITVGNIPGAKVYEWDFVITDDGTTITATWTQSDDPTNTFTLTAECTTDFATDYIAFTVVNGYLNDVTISTEAP